MSHFIWWSNMFGLLISIGGSALLFWGTPRDTPNLPPANITSIDRALYYRDLDINEEYKKVNNRKIKSQVGIFLIAIGFLFQVLSQFFQYPK